MSEAPPRAAVDALGAQLEAAAVRALLEAYDGINYTHFQLRLRHPTLQLTASGPLGRWVPTHRTIELSRALLLEHPWGAVVEVLKHEMAHQYVHEVLGVYDEAAHGETFRRVCHDRAIDARAAGVPSADGPGAAPGSAQARVLERVAKLLALASSPDEHEAESAMNAARRLMLKHNLDEVSAHGARDYCTRQLGEPSGRVDEKQRILGNILNEHFFVRTIWVPVWRVREGKPGSVLEVSGTRENVEMAAYVHSFLSHTAEGLWLAHKRARRLGDRDRRAYIAGVMAGFRDKLEREKRSDGEKGLVWVGDPALEGFFRRRYPRVRTVHRSSSANQHAHEHGREAGRNIVLAKPVEGGASGGVRGQLGRG